MVVERGKVLEMRGQGLTYEEIGNRLGVTRQRAHQIKTRTSLKYRNRIKALVLTHYGNGELKCTRCGFGDIRALTVDHLQGSGTKHKKGLGLKGIGFYNWLKKSGYPEGYQTLCMNCQFIKKHESNEWGGGTAH